MNVRQRGHMSQPPLRVTVFPLIVLIVRTPPLIAQFPVCVPPPFVVTVTTLALDSYCLPWTIVSPLRLLFCLFPIVFYCLLVPIVSWSLLSLCSYCLFPPIVLSGLLPSTGQLLKPSVCTMYSLSRVSCQSQ
jgi:hypothetical protein